jgi:TupA-like ATPgrasp
VLFLKYVAASSEPIGLHLKAKYLPYDTPWLRFVIDAILFPSDMYKIVVDFTARFNRLPNFFRPKSFNEMLQQRKLFCRKRLYVQLADKLAVRSYVEDRIGEEYLNDLLWFGPDIREAKQVQLPVSFIIKPNHASSLGLVVTDSECFDWDLAHETTQKWLSIDHSSSYAEWQYRWIRPMLLIERLLPSDSENPPIDYKFYCFNGKARFVQVDIDKHTDHTQMMVDRDFQLLPFRYRRFRRCSRKVEKPANFATMIELAEKLAGDEKFVRVDLYNVNGHPVFGEITIQPGAGREIFDPPEWDCKVLDFFRNNVDDQ